METSTKKSGIPVSVSPSIKSRIRKLSKGSDGNSLNSFDSDIDTFTLLEENISLKETKSQLIVKNTETLQKNLTLENENAKLLKQLDESNVQQEILKEKLRKAVEKFDKEFQTIRQEKNTQDELKLIINNLRQKLRSQEKQLEQLIQLSHQAKLGFKEYIPTEKNVKDDNGNPEDDLFASETIERLVSDISNIKTYSNITELQLYESNEKNAELAEINQMLEQENQNLKIENSNLHKVAKMMTTSMRESVDTNKKMEQAFIKIRKRNDELFEESREYVDSPTSPKVLPSEEVVKLREEMKKKEITHNERIVEMTKLMETNHSVEYEMLQLKLEIVESNLRIAIERAEKAETELEKLKTKMISPIDESSKLILKNQFNGIENKATNTSPLQLFPPQTATLDLSTVSTLPVQPLPTIVLPLAPSPPPPPSLPPPPPPPPPPSLPPSSQQRPQFLRLNLPPTNSTTSGTSLGDGIATLTLRKLNDHNPSNQQVKATGMDALIAQLKNGNVTLRRNRDRPKYSAAIKEMFDVLEIAKKQNRMSAKLVDDTQMAYSESVFDI